MLKPKRSSPFSSKATCFFYVQRLSLLLLLSCFVAMPVFADDALVDAEKSETQPQTLSAKQILTKKIRSMNEFSASFKQKVVDEDQFVMEEVTGFMSFEKSGKLYWQVEAPFSSTLVSDGQSIYYFDPDLNQVTIRPWEQNMASSPLAVLLDNGNVTDAFTVKENDNVFELLPIDPSADYQSLQLTFKGHFLQKLVLLDSFGQTTQVDFFEPDPMLERALPKNPYEFTPPLGAEIIVE